MQNLKQPLSIAVALVAAVVVRALLPEENISGVVGRSALAAEAEKVQPGTAC